MSAVVVQQTKTGARWTGGLVDYVSTPVGALRIERSPSAPTYVESWTSTGWQELLLCDFDADAVALAVALLTPAAS